MKKIFLFLIFIVFLNAQEISQKTPTSKDQIIKFYVDDKSYISQNELVKLILKTDSIDDDERQYWFDIMPSMNEQQIQKLFNILETERKKQEELGEEYLKQIKYFNDIYFEGEDYRTKKNNQELISDDSVLFIIKNESEDKENRPYILLPKSKLGNKEYIMKDFNKLFLSKNSSKSISNMFNDFALSVEFNFNKYYEIYNSDIFEILDTYYHNLAYLKELKKPNLVNLQKLKILVKDKDNDKYEQLNKYANLYYYTNLPIDKVNDTLDYLYNTDIKADDIFFRLHYSLCSSEDNEKVRKFINRYIDEIRNNNYSYFLEYRKKATKEKNIKANIIRLSLALEKYKYIIDKDVIKKTNEFINEIILDDTLFQNRHYYLMTKLFIENKTEWNIKIHVLKERYEKDIFNNELEAQLLEYLTYDALRKEIEKKDYAKDLDYLKDIRLNIMKNSTAHNYIEIKFIDYLKKEYENKKALKDKLVDNIIFFMLIILSILLSIITLIQFIFGKLLLKNKVCHFVELLLLFEYKGIATTTEKLLIYKLKKWLNKKLDRKIDDTTLGRENNLTIKNHINNYEYTNEDEKYYLAKKAAINFNLLPIVMHNSLDLNIGCLDNLLFQRNFTKYLFIVDRRNFNINNKLDIFIHNLAEKYVDAKIIVFNQKKN